MHHAEIPLKKRCDFTHHNRNQATNIHYIFFALDKKILYATGPDRGYCRNLFLQKIYLME